MRSLGILLLHSLFVGCDGTSHRASAEDAIVDSNFAVDFSADFALDPITSSEIPRVSAIDPDRLIEIEESQREILEIVRRVHPDEYDALMETKDVETRAAIETDLLSEERDQVPSTSPSPRHH